MIFLSCQKNHPLVSIWILGQKSVIPIKLRFLIDILIRYIYFGQICMRIL